MAYIMRKGLTKNTGSLQDIAEQRHWSSAFNVSAQTYQGSKQPTTAPAGPRAYNKFLRGPSVAS